MNRSHDASFQTIRWSVAVLAAAAAALVMFLPVILGGDVITLPSVLAAAAVLAVTVLAVMWDARRRTFIWMATLALPLGVLAVIIHNLEYALMEVEEPTFLFLGMLGGPAVFLAGLAGLIMRAEHRGHGRSHPQGA